MTDTRTFRPLSKATWGIYLLFVAIRVFVAFQPGYIHPDEYFQNAEITAGKLFNLSVNTPWEYLPQNPCRSILAPAITTGIPYAILKATLGTHPGKDFFLDRFRDSDHYVPASLLFGVERASFLVLSLFLDALIVRIARQIRRSPSIALFLVSSSYVTLTYHTHPFSNTIEAVVLAMCITVLCSIVNDIEASCNTKGIRTRTFLLGLLFALGAFTRITFVLYGFPLGVTFLFVVAKAIATPSTTTTTSSPDPSISTPSLGKATTRFLIACLPLALGIVLGVSINIVLDSLFFGKLTIVHAATQQPIASWTEVLDPFAWRDLQFQGTLTVTFLNNLLYNLDKDNLAQHGLHPRYLHLLVNFPVLFANLAYVGVKAIGEKIFAQKQCVSQSTLVTALAYSGISGILLLSVMPHQEARFLTPLLIPLVLTTASRVSKLGRKFWPLWLVYNGVLAIVFGTFHQAGVTPAIAELQTQALGITNCQTIPLRSGSTSSHVGCDTNTSPKGIYHLNRNGNETYITHTIYYKTYMPPYHLYGLNEQDAENHGIKLEISDWRTKDREELIKALSEIPAAKDPNHRLLIEEAFVENPNKALFFESAPGIYWRNVLIAPSTVDLSDQPFYNTRLSFTPHANLDHMDVILQRPFSSFSMNIYYI